MKPNLVQGNVAAKRANSPAPLAKSKRANLVQTKPDTADARIQRELTTGQRNNKNSRGGR